MPPSRGDCLEKRPTTIAVDPRPDPFMQWTDMPPRAAAPKYAGRMSESLARAVSLLGHPLVLLPLTVVALSSAQGDAASRARIAIGMALFAGIVLSWSWWQVRRGRWEHVDASGKRERRALNRFLLAALTLATGIAAWRSEATALVAGLAMSAALIAVAMATSRWCKLSLHMAFAVYAAILLWQLHAGLGMAIFVFSAAIAWSRLALRRHSPMDLAAGAMTGLLAGASFRFLAAM